LFTQATRNTEHQMAGYVKRMNAVVGAYVVVENMSTGNCVGDHCVYQNLLQLYMRSEIPTIMAVNRSCCLLVCNSVKFCRLSYVISVFRRAVRFLLFWDFTSVIWKLVADVLGKPIGPIFVINPLKMWPIGCTKTSVTNYQSSEVLGQPIGPIFIMNPIEDGTDRLSRNVCNKLPIYRSFGTTYQSNLYYQSSWRWDRGCPETSVTNYQSTIRKIPEELKYQN
jgi:hypothetical protein